MSVLISLSPNTEKDDVLLAARVLIKPWTWKHRRPVENARALLSKKVNNQEVVLTNSGRTAIFTALKAIDLNKDDEVIIQAFTCSTVPAAVKWIGAKPVYADIDPRTYNLDPVSVRSRITGNSRAIIIQHTFGIPAPMDELLQLARIYNLFVIEDCAHALGAAYRQQPVGTFGDVSIFSFGRDKSLSSVHGGAVSSKRPEIIHAAKKINSDLPMPPAWWVAQQLMHPLIMALVTKTYYFMSFGKIALLLFQRLHLISKAVTPREKSGHAPAMLAWQASPALAVLLINQLNKLQRFTKRRRAVASAYKEKMPQIGPEPVLHSSPSWLRYPVRVNNSAALISKARQKHIMLGDWYPAPVYPGNPALFGYKSGSCPNAESAARHTVNLPTYPKIKDEKVNEVIETVLTAQKHML